MGKDNVIGRFSYWNFYAVTIFIQENDGIGTLDINTFYMGAGNGVSGTGDIATIVFTANTSGDTFLNFSDYTQMADADGNIITIQSKARGMVVAK